MLRLQGSWREEYVVSGQSRGLNFADEQLPELCQIRSPLQVSPTAICRVVADHSARTISCVEMRPV